MGLPKIERQKRTPLSGEESQSITDYNLEAVGTFMLPHGPTLTLNGADSSQSYYIRGYQGKLYLYVNSEWKEVSADLSNYYNKQEADNTFLKQIDGLKEVAGLSIDNNILLVEAPVLWRIDGVDYFKNSNTNINIPVAAEGFNRIDLIYADKNNNILRLEGQESEGIAVPPATPINTIIVTTVSINGDSIGNPIPDLTMFLTKTQADSWYSVVSPTGSYIQADANPSQKADINLEGKISLSGNRDFIRFSIKNNNPTGYQDMFLFDDGENYAGFQLYNLGKDGTTSGLPTAGLAKFIARTGNALLIGTDLIRDQENTPIYFAVGVSGGSSVHALVIQKDNTLLVPSLSGTGDRIIGVDENGQLKELLFGTPNKLAKFSLQNGGFSDSNVTVLENGNVGINVDNPERSLHLKGNNQTSGPVLLIEEEENTPLWLRVSLKSLSSSFELGIASESGQFMDYAQAGDAIFKAFGSGSNGICFGTSQNSNSAIFRLNGSDKTAVFYGDVLINTLSGTGDRNLVAGADGKIKIGNPDMSVGVTVNSPASSLALNQRGYYNYIGSGATAWSLPSVTGIAGRFYRIYNKAADSVSTITITPNGTDKLFQGGVRLSTIILQYGENLTLVSDGIDWNIYG